MDSVSLTDFQLKEIKRVSASLSEIKKVESADVNLFFDNVFEFTQCFLNEFMELGKIMTEIKSLYEELSHKLTKAAEGFGMISLQFKKMNYAKTQFPYFEQSNINLDLVYTRYKLMFYGLS